VEAIQNYPQTTIILDTEIITIEIWLEFYGYRVPEWIPKYLETCDYNYYLFHTDLPWVADGLRNNPHDRDILFQRFVDKLTQYQKRYKIVDDLEGFRLSDSR
jgi:nicotinamide riboside kinase